MACGRNCVRDVVGGTACGGQFMIDPVCTTAARCNMEPPTSAPARPRTDCNVACRMRHIPLRLMQRRASPPPAPARPHHVCCGLSNQRPTAALTCRKRRPLSRAFSNEPQRRRSPSGHAAGRSASRLFACLFVCLFRRPSVSVALRDQSVASLEKVLTPTTNLVMAFKACPPSASAGLLAPSSP